MPNTTASINLLWLISIPVISALVGWSTNWIAIKMLFFPRSPFRLGWFKIQGVIPSRRNELAESIGSIVAGRLLPMTELSATLLTPENCAAVEREIVSAVEEYVDRKISEEPVAKMLLVGPLRSTLNANIERRVRSFTPSLLNKVATSLNEAVDVKEIIRSKVSKLDILDLEQLVLEVAGRELKVIEVLGAVIGGVIGLFQVGAYLAFP